MKVYLILQEDEDRYNDYVVGVCQSRELAERYIELHKRTIDDRGKLQYNEFSIEEWDTDKITKDSLTEFENSHRFGYEVTLHGNNVIATSSYGMLPDGLDFEIISYITMVAYVECKEGEVEKAKEIARDMVNRMIDEGKNDPNINPYFKHW